MKEILSPYLIECKSNKTWDAFIKESPDGNIYSISDYLESYNEKISKLFLKEGNQILASVIIISPVERSINPLAFSSFQGVCIRSIEGKKHSVMTKRMNIIKALLEKLTEKYSNHFLSLNPTFNDIRPFQWHNFHQAQKGKYSISIKYTGVIDFNDFANFDKYIEEISYRRKSDLKKSKKFNFNIDESKNLEKFVEIYLKVFERQSIKIKQKDLKIIKNIINKLTNLNLGKLYSASDFKNQIVGFNFIMNYKNTSSYLFGAIDPEFRSTGIGTELLINSIEQSYNSSKRYFDLVGINSPARGDFKTSLAANPKIYFNVNFDL